jgi:hypothetical protein
VKLPQFAGKDKDNVLAWIHVIELALRTHSIPEHLKVANVVPLLRSVLLQDIRGKRTHSYVARALAGPDPTLRKRNSSAEMAVQQDAKYSIFRPFEDGRLL